VDRDRPVDVTATWLEEKVSKPLKIAILGFWHGHEKDYARSTKQHPGADLVLLDAVLQHVLVAVQSQRSSLAT
jgi:hypothetical protein